MMGFIEWVEFQSKRKTKEKKDERSASKAGQQNGAVGDKGQATGNDTKVYTTDVYDFTNTQWQDYRGGGNA